MIQLISLFNSQTDVSQAIAVLGAEDIRDKDIQVWEQMPPLEDSLVEAPFISTHPSMFGDAVRPVASVPAEPVQKLPLSKEKADFVRRAVSDGSILLLVTVPDEALNRAKTIITEQNGRILETAV